MTQAAILTPALPTRIIMVGNGSRKYLTDSQAKVLMSIVQHGPMTDLEIGYAYRLTHNVLDQTWSGLRTRRAELVDMGVVYAHKLIRNERNREVTVWAANDYFTTQQ